ncbi:MAG: hypothetical protein NTU98_06330 [Bacteroidetes bacterium]|nr:hypothetical protein [Bacteroidota bacterium]
MKTFVKNYIGKGKKIEGLQIVKMNFKIADLLQFAHKYNNEDYITVEIAKLKEPDKFGRDYTAYVSVLEEDEPKKATSKKGAKKSKKSTELIPSSDIPF